MEKSTSKLKMSLGAIFIMIFASGLAVVDAADKRHFCDGFEKRNSSCPTVAQFDIFAEYDKPSTEWKLDFEVRQFVPI